MQEDKYTLIVGGKGAERLQLANQIHNPYAQAFLKKAGLKPGMSVLEVGCGSGDMCCWLAETVGETGSVLAIDQSEEQINFTNEQIAGTKLTNVTTKVHSIYQLSQLNQQFDFIYCRWVLVHLTRPLDALQQLSLCLNNNATLVIIDVDTLGYYFAGAPSFGKELGDFISNQFIAMNKDHNIGIKLIQLMKQSGLQPFLAENYQEMFLTKKDKAIFQMGIDEFIEGIKNSQDQATTAALQSKLANAVNSSEYIYGERNTLVAARAE